MQTELRSSVEVAMAYRWMVTLSLVLFSQIATAQESTIRFFSYSDLNGTPEELVTVNLSTIQNSKINPAYPTRIIIHGFLCAIEDEVVTIIRDAYLRRNHFNVIAVDWAILARGLYPAAAHSVIEVGQATAQLISLLVQLKRINPDSVIIVGFSLGAHCAGYAGRSLGTYSIEGIVALDPAAPLFDWKTAVYATDAKYVQVIHTQTGLVGYRDPLGHADFYVNFGDNQPGCNFMDIVCCHMAAARYFAKSIEDPLKFIGQRCRTHMGFLFGKCDPEECGVECRQMGGEPLDTKAEGVYYVKVQGGRPDSSFWKC